MICLFLAVVSNCFQAFRPSNHLNLMSRDESKNPYPLGNRTLSNSVGHQDLETTWPVPVPDGPPHWKMCNIPMGMGSWYQRPPPPL